MGDLKKMDELAEEQMRKAEKNKIPQKPSGFPKIGCGIFLLIILVGGLISTVTNYFEEKKTPPPVEKKIEKVVKPPAPKYVTPVKDIIGAAAVPKIYSDANNAKIFFESANVQENSIAITSETNFNLPNAILIYRSAGAYIDEIVCYPAKAGINFSVEATKTLIKNFVDVQNFAGSFANSEASIFVGDPTPKPTIYAWQYNVGANPTTFIIQEENGIATAFCIFQSNSSHFVPFFTSAAGYRLTQKAAGIQSENRPAQTSTGAANNFDKYDSEKKVSSAYVGNANTGKFHRSTCSQVRKMNPANVVELSSRDDAINSGYVPCKKCNP